MAKNASRIQKPNEPMVGQKIVVWNDNDARKTVRIFVSMGDPTEKKPIKTVGVSDENYFYRGEIFECVLWQHWEPAPEKYAKIQELEKELFEMVEMRDKMNNHVKDQIDLINKMKEGK